MIIIKMAVFYANPEVTGMALCLHSTETYIFITFAAQYCLNLYSYGRNSQYCRKSFNEGIIFSQKRVLVSVIAMQTLHVRLYM